MKETWQFPHWQLNELELGLVSSLQRWPKAPLSLNFEKLGKDQYQALPKKA